VRASSWKLGQKRPDTTVVDMGICDCSGAGRLLCNRAMLLLMRLESVRSCAAELCGQQIHSAIQAAVDSRSYPNCPFA